MSLEARAISVVLGGRPILREVSLRIPDGSLLALLGPNGSGKSTLTRALCGTLRVASGHVLLNEQGLGAVSSRSIAREIAVVAQRGPTPPLISVLEHVWLGRHPHRRWLSGTTRDDLAAVEAAIDACDLGDLLDRPVEVLSGGERQRVRIATALAQDARHLLLDEPLTGLDIEHQLDLLALLLRINRERGIAVVVVLHDLDHAARHFPRLALLREGQIVADGPPAEVLCASAFESVFRVDGCVSHDRQRGERVVVCTRLCDRYAEQSPASSQLSEAARVEPPLVVVTSHGRAHAGLSLKESPDVASVLIPRCPALDGEPARPPDHDW
jgi:iron complex transport system ATP-binding protein